MKKFIIAFVTIISLIIPAAAWSQTPQEALDNGNLAQALSMLEKQSTDDDTQTAVSGLCGQAQIAAAQSNFDKALQLLDDAENKLNADKKAAKSGYHAIIPYLKANALRSKGDFESAVSQIKKARDQEGTVSLADGWAGFIEYEASFDFNEDNAHARKAAEAAIAAFHKAKLHREQGYAELQLANLELARGKDRRAFLSYDNALKAFRNDGNSQKAIAETQLLIAEKQIALEEFKAATSRLQIAQQEIEAAGSPQDLLAKLSQLQQQLPAE